MNVRSSSLASRLVAGVIVAMMVTGAGAGAAPPASPSSWSQVPTQFVSGESFLFQSVASPAPGDVWAIGYHQEDVGGAFEFRTLAEHYDGTHFVIVPTPDREGEPTVDLLMGAAGASAGDLWSVGSSSPGGGASETLVEHWNGTAWSIATSPDPGTLANGLEAVSAVSARDAWAVGYRQDTSTFFERPLALHWTGSAWSAVSVPEAAGCTGHSYLTAVSAVSATDVWAAGWCGSGGTAPAFAYIDHWNGAVWKVAAGVGTTPTGSELYGISADRSNVWAVGYTTVPGSSPAVGLSMHLVAGTWRVVPVPATDGPYPQAVAALRDGGAWSVGAGTSPQPPFGAPFSMHFGDGAWRALPTPPPFGRLTGVALDSTGAVWADGFTVGAANDRGLVLVRH